MPSFPLRPYSCDGEISLALFTGLGFIAYGVGLVVIGLAIHAARRHEPTATPSVAT